MPKSGSTQQRFLLLIFFIGLAFALPLWDLLAHYDQHKPDGIRLFIPLIACGWAWLRLREQELHAAYPSLAFSCGLVSCVVCILLYALPVFSMRFWQLHWLMLPLFSIACMTILFGKDAIRKVWPVLAYLLLLWPPLIHLLSQIFTPILLSISEGGTFTFVRMFDLPVHVPSEHMLTCQAPDGSAQLRIGSPCSGINGFLALIMCLIPLLWQGEIKKIHILTVSACGFILLCMLSILRLSTLVWLTCNYGLDNAFYWFHLLGGSVFFGILCIAVFLFSALLGLKIKIPPIDKPAQRPLHHAMLAYLAAFALVLCVSTALLQLKPLIPKPPSIMHHYAINTRGHAMPDLEGYESWHVREMEWTKPLFGDHSQFDRYAYQKEEVYFWVDSLLVTDFDKLELHNVFDCYRWHDYQLISQDFESAIGDLPARRYHYRDNNEREWISITWIESIKDEEQIWWQRFHVQLEYKKGNTVELMKEMVFDFSKLMSDSR